MGLCGWVGDEDDEQRHDGHQRTDATDDVADDCSRVGAGIDDLSLLPLRLVLSSSQVSDVLDDRLESGGECDRLSGRGSGHLIPERLGRRRHLSGQRGCLGCLNSRSRGHSAYVHGTNGVDALGLGFTQLVLVIRPERRRLLEVLDVLLALLGSQRDDLSQVIEIILPQLSPETENLSDVLLLRDPQIVLAPDRRVDQLEDVGRGVHDGLVVTIRRRTLTG